MSMTEQAKGKREKTRTFLLPRAKCIALALTGWLLYFQLKVWLYCLVKSAADLHQEVSVAIKSKTGKHLRKLITKSAKS